MKKKAIDFIIELENDSLRQYLLTEAEPQFFDEMVSCLSNAIALLFRWGSRETEPARVEYFARLFDEATAKERAERT